MILELLTLDTKVKSLKQHLKKQQLYGHLPPISKTIQIKHAGHSWRNKDQLIIDVLQWTPSHGLASVERPARTYIQQVCTDTGCCLEDLSEATDDRDEWREKDFGKPVLVTQHDDDDDDDDVETLL